MMTKTGWVLPVQKKKRISHTDDTQVLNSKDVSVTRASQQGVHAPREPLCNSQPLALVFRQGTSEMLVFVPFAEERKEHPIM